MSDRHLLYIVGIPGSGKSALAAALVKGRRRRVRTSPFAHTVYDGGLVQLGRERAAFSGTDALSLSVLPQVLAALDIGYWPKVLGEGDRLTNHTFFDGARAAGYKVDIALLDTPVEVAAARRAERGSNQDAVWLKGRVTKIERLRGQATILLPGELPVAELAILLSGHPVLSMTE